MSKKFDRKKYGSLIMLLYILLVGSLCYLNYPNKQHNSVARNFQIAATDSTRSIKIE